MNRLFFAAGILLAALISPLNAAAQDWAVLEIDGQTMQFAATAGSLTDGEMVFGQTGLYRRMPGAEWTRVGDTPPASPVVFGGELVLAGIAPPCLQDGQRMEMQRSADGGATWAAVPDTEGFQPIGVVSEANLAFAFSCQGLYSSADLGETWVPVSEVELAGYEVTSSAVLQSDEGQDLTMLLGLTSEGGTSHLISVSVDDESTVTVSEPLHEYWGRAALAGKGDTFLIGAANGVFLSTDRGETWEQIRAGLEEVTVDFDPLVEFPTDVEPGSFGLTAATFTSGSIVLGTVEGLYVTSEPREGWRRMEGLDGEVGAVVLESNGTAVIAQTEQGVFELPIDLSITRH